MESYREYYGEESPYDFGYSSPMIGYAWHLRKIVSDIQFNPYPSIQQELKLMLYEEHYKLRDPSKRSDPEELLLKRQQENIWGNGGPFHKAMHGYYHAGIAKHFGIDFDKFMNLKYPEYLAMLDYASRLTLEESTENEKVKKQIQTMVEAED